MRTKPKRDLSQLPLRYQPFGKNWRDIKTGAVIRDENITDYIPKAPEVSQVKHEVILAKRYDLRAG